METTEPGRTSPNRPPGVGPSSSTGEEGSRQISGVERTNKRARDDAPLRVAFVDDPEVLNYSLEHARRAASITQEEVDRKAQELSQADKALIDSDKDGRISVSEWQRAIQQGVAGVVALMSRPMWERNVQARQSMARVLARRANSSRPARYRRAGTYRRKTYSRRVPVLRARRAYRRRW